MKQKPLKPLTSREQDQAYALWWKFSQTELREQLHHRIECMQTARAGIGLANRWELRARSQMNLNLFNAHRRQLRILIAALELCIRRYHIWPEGQAPFDTREAA